MYGEEAVLRGYWNNTPLKDVRGREYPKPYRDFLAHLRETYKPLLTVSE